ncbi:MAG: hypothetical protein M0Q15_10550 [Nevskia sp.]|jgi:hypothetical protein|nr:hypothetical protein [Nevskia sp.]
MALTHRLRGAAVKIEPTYGTDSTPSATTDAVLCRKIDISEPLSQQGVDREVIRPYFGQYTQLLGAAFGKVDLEVEVAGFGTAGPAAPTAGLDALLRCCGHARTVTAGTNVIYNEASTALSSVTVYVWQHGTLHKFTGCFGEMGIDLSEDAVPIYKFSLTGLYQPVTDTALPTFTLSGYVQPVLANATNTVGASLRGFAAEIKSFSFQQNNQIEKAALIGSTREVKMTDRKPSGSIEIRATTVAMFDWWTAIQNATLGALTITHGTVSGNRVTIASATGLQLINPKFSEDRGFTNLAMDLRFVPSNAGNDAYSITVS